MELKRIHQDFSVCQVEDYSLVNLDSEYSFIGKTDEEKSLVCISSEIPANVVQHDDGWKAFRIQGVLNFSLVGILEAKNTKGHWKFFMRQDTMSQTDK